MGQILTITDMGYNNFDQCTVLFRGKVVAATCCHPGMVVGAQVNMVETPRGVWWATVLQPSWFSVPLSEYIDRGLKAVAAIEYLLRDNPRWRPTLILIDKRGVQQPEPEPEPEPEPTPSPYPWDPNDPDHPQDFEYFDVNHDNYIDPTEWPYDPSLFDVWDLDDDGLISEEEWYKRGYDPAFWPVSGWLAWIDSTGGIPNVYMVQRVGGADYPSKDSSGGSTGLPWLANYFGSPYKAPIPTDIYGTIGGKNRRYIRGYSGSTLLRLKIGIENGASWWGDPGDVVARTTAAHEAYKATLGVQTLCIYTVGSGVQAWNIDLTRVTASTPVPPGATGAFYIGDYWEIIL